MVGPLMKTEKGNSVILTIQDDLTRYVLAIPLPNHLANTVARAFVTKFVCVHGIPETILNDQGIDFVSNIFKEVYKLLKINKVQSSAFHPQSNGSIERYHRVFAEYL